MDALEKLKWEYVSSLTLKLETIAITVNAIMNSVKEKMPPDWRTLEHLVHKFAGSSGTYGFRELSIHAKVLEENISTNELQGKSELEQIRFLNEWKKTFEAMIKKTMNGANKRKKAA